jgi:general secretion pathway protein L
MTRYRIRVRRDTLAGGGFEWAVLDEKGRVRESGSSALDQKLPPGACDLVLAGDLVLLERLSVPVAQQRRLSDSLRFLAEDAALPDPERLHVASEPFPAKDALAVAVVDRQWLKELLAALHRAGLVPRSAVPECLLPPIEPGSWCVVCNGPDSFVRVAELQGFALDSPRPGETPVALRLAVEHGRPEKIVLRAAPGMSVPDVRRWSATLGVPVEAGPPWHWAEFAGRPGIDLLQREFARRGAEDGWRAKLRRPAILAGALLAAVTFGIGAEWWAKAREQRLLIAEMRAIYRETFGDAAVIVDPPLQMKRAAAELRSRSGEASPGDFIPLLGSLSAQMLDPARQRIDRIDYEHGRLHVLLRPHDPGQLNVLRAELQAKPAPRGFVLRVDTAESGRSPGLRLTLTPEETRWASGRP